MAFVITELCADLKDASCVDVCPVDCIQTTDSVNQYFIDPEICIDCGACLPECPVDAIFEEDEVPAEYSDAAERNRRFFAE